METKQAKLKPFHIVIILVVVAALSVVLYLYKDDLMANPNAAYEELYSTFLPAEGTIVGFENSKGRRTGVIYTIQFHDQNDNLITVTENNWQTAPLNKGDKVTMYYNPQDPEQATPESRWREIMRK